ncbi:MAG: DUF3427 domain-containing protein, partial [Jiangellaceae bacterium]
ELLKRMRYVVHVDDIERADAYARLASLDGPLYADLTEREQRLARMLIFTLWPRGGFGSYESALATLRRNQAVCAEIRDLVTLGLDRARHVPASLGMGLQHVPLASHVRYRREEILAALDYARLDRPPSIHQAGVAWAEATQTDALLVTVHKTEKDFLPSTMYRDYAISPELFHWESQNTTSLTSPVGQRYLHHRERGSHVVLFVRDHPNDDIGAAPYLCLGAASYVEHRGERPIAITWKLHRPMPADTFTSASVVA